MSQNRFRLASVAAITGIAAALLLAGATSASADSAAPALSLIVSPSQISTVDLTKPHALDITVRCATTIGTLTVTMTEPAGTILTLQPGVTVNGTSKGFDVSLTPAAHGDYVLNATSSGCGDSAPVTVTATGPDIVTNLATSPGQLSAADFAATGVTFTGTGFHAGVSLSVTSTAPGFTPTTITTDDGGGFSFVQTGQQGTPDGYYSTSFTGQQDGVSLGTYLVGTAPPTSSEPKLTLSTHRLTLSQYLSTGVTATATGYAPGDLVIAEDTAPTGVEYFRGNGPPDAAGAFSVIVTGAANASADRVGVHTVTFSSFLGPDASDSFEVVPDPVAAVVVAPDPVEQGAPIRFTATNLVPGASYLLLPDQPLASGGPIVFAADGEGAAVVDDSVPDDYPLGAHSAMLLVIGTSAGPPPSIRYTVIAPVPMVSVEPSTVRQGERLTVTGTKFEPDASYRLHFDAAVGDGEDPVVTSNEDGAFDADVTVPTDYPVGQHTVAVTADTPVSAALWPGTFAQAAGPVDPSATFTVLAAAATSTPTPTPTPAPTPPNPEPSPAPSTGGHAADGQDAAKTALADTGSDVAPWAVGALAVLGLGLAALGRRRAVRREARRSS